MNSATQGADAAKAKEQLSHKHDEEKKKLQEFKAAKEAELKAKQEFHKSAAYALLMAQTKKGLADTGRVELKAENHPLLKELIDFSPEKEEDGEVEAALEFSEVKWDEIELGPEVGQGAFGKVYKGTCKWIEVAVKELKNELTEDAKKKFQNEARLLSNLKHESIIQFIGMCTEKDSKGVEHFTLLTEFATNGSLSDYIGVSTRKKFPPSEKVRILREVASGMKFLHNFSGQAKSGVTEILHLDLKPANILLDDCWRARIADFGMSRVIAPADKPNEFLSFVSKTVGGTPLYMAPELLAGTGAPPTKACDVYSFGIMCWEVLQDDMEKDKPLVLYPPSALVSIQTLKEHVVVKKLRPIAPTAENPLTHHSPYQHCAKCWNAEPSQRPTFTDLDISLALAPWSDILSYYLEVPDKQTLEGIKAAMKREGHGKDGSAVTRISWENFKAEFSKIQSTLNEVDRGDTRALAALLGVDLTDGSGGADKYVENQKWTYLHKWFGPFQGRMGECMNLMYEIATKSWFFGELTEPQSNELLAFQPLGTFLVRYSVKMQGIFTVSYVSDPVPEDKEKYGDVLLVYHERFHDIRAAGLVSRVTEFTTKNPNKKLRKMSPCPGRPDIFTRLVK